MYCRECGARSSDGSARCTSCGAALSTNPYESPAVAPGSMSGAGGKPKNYLVESILVTLCCCLPLGIVAIVFAAQVDSKWNGGDQAGAISAADNAKKFVMIGFFLGLVTNLLIFGLQILAGFGAAAQNRGF